MKSIDELLHDNSQISVGTAISKGWDIVAKNAGHFVLATLLMIIFSAVSGLIPIIGPFANALVISPALSAGFVLVCWLIHKGEGWESFGQWFKGFDYIKELIIQALIYIGITLVLSVLILFKFITTFIEIYRQSSGSETMRNRDDIMAVLNIIFSPGNILFFILFIVVILILTIIWIFKVHFVVVYNMGAWEAMEASRKVAQRNFFPLLGLLILLTLINAVGFLACGIGLLFTIPVTIAAIYHAFAQLTLCDEVIVVQPEDPLDSTVTMY